MLIINKISTREQIFSSQRSVETSSHFASYLYCFQFKWRTCRFSTRRGTLLTSITTKASTWSTSRRKYFSLRYTRESAYLPKEDLLNVVFSVSNWSKLGLEGWEVTIYPSDAPFQVQVILRWTSLQDFEAAMSAPVTPELFDDVKNFTTAEPVLLKGTPYTSSTTK
jgi:hypothetical protein